MIMQNNFPSKSAAMTFLVFPTLLHLNAKDVCLAQVDLKFYFVFFIARKCYSIKVQELNIYVRILLCFFLSIFSLQFNFWSDFIEIKN